MKNTLTTAVRENNIPLATKLLENGADANVMDPNTGETPLFYVKSPEMASLLLHYNANPLVTNDKGYTPLYEPTISVDTKITLLCRGMDPNHHIEKLGKMDTPLHYCLKHKDEKLAKALVDSYAIILFDIAEDVKALIGTEVYKQLNTVKSDSTGKIVGYVKNMVKKEKEEPQQVADSEKEESKKSAPKCYPNKGCNAKDENGQTPLFFVKDSEMVDLLVKYGADPHARDRDSQTPLFFAKNSEVVGSLVKYGTDLDVQDDYGSTALHYNANQPDILEALLKNGANPNIKNKCGFTPLNTYTVFLSKNSTEAVRLLLQYKADPNIAADNDQTPLSRSLARGNKEATLLLLNHGAHVNGLAWLELKMVFRVSDTDLKPLFVLKTGEDGERYYELKEYMRKKNILLDKVMEEKMGSQGKSV